MRNAGLEETQAEIKSAGRNINNLRYADDTALMAESEELKSLLMKVKENEKVGLKINIQKPKIMASGPITSWQIEGEKVRSVIFLASKIIVVIAAMKLRHLLLERKAMTNLELYRKAETSLCQKRSFAKRIMVFPVVMYGCES